uniref:Skp1-related protein n=1 Tax=Acrobeloides nanus TaxID=290746 RepID=A0A914BV64_9BILA
MATESANGVSSPELNERDVVITTNDNRNFTVKIGVARVSKTINNMIQDLGESLDLSSGIPLPNVDGPIFEKVLEWCEEHKNAPEIKVEQDPHTRERKWFTMTEWEEEYFRKFLSHLWDLAMAANYLEIPSLYYYTCQKLAERIKGRTPEQIREMFGIEDDLTEEEKAEIRRTNVWCTY